jgi:Methyltransferase domain
MRLRHAIGETIGRPRRWRVLEILPRNAVGAELGVYKGDFTQQILRITKPRELHLIDGWWTVEGESYEHDWYGYQGVSETRAAYEQVERLAAEHPECRVHVGDDLAILPRFPDGHFDWVYLDTSHEYEHTAAELEVLRHKVSGFIAGDDWYPDPTHEHHGVYRAVTEFCDRHGWEQVWGAGDPWVQWAIRKR